MAELVLGRSTEYPREYTPELLYPVPRAGQRQALGLDATLPFVGVDLWRGYELSWLNERGRPECAQALFAVPCESVALVESKSFKLYLNSLNQSRFKNAGQLQQVLQQDLGAAAGAKVQVTLLPVNSGTSENLPWSDVTSLDQLDVACEASVPDAGLLSCRSEVVEQALSSDLFRSLCPVTGQPDWGTLLLRYRGPAIDQDSLLRYVVSFRDHQGFHEDCVERIFCDLLRECKPEWLVLGIQFLRRGGLEINPWRWTPAAPVTSPQLVMRTARQ